MASYYLLRGSKKANFAFAFFAFTALIDMLFHVTGFYTSSVPLYGMILFFIYSVFALWVAFTNTFNLGRITFPGTVLSFILGNAVDYFFNYF
jgi:hypothetical protein